MSDEIQALIDERGERYGDFTFHAGVVEALIQVVMSHPGWNNLLPFHKQAIRVTFDKLARTLNGDPSYIDNVDDILGYWQLVKERMEHYERMKEARAKQQAEAKAKADAAELEALRQEKLSRRRAKRNTI